MASLSANNVYVWGQRTALPHAGLAPGRQIRLDTDDVQAVREHVPGIAAVAPSVELGGWRQGNNVTYEDRVGNFGVRGETPQFLEVAVDRPYQGRFINETDMQERRKVTVIGEAVRHMLLHDVDPIGRYIQIRGVYFQVVGVLASIQGGDDAERTDNTVVIPLSTFQTAFNGGNRVAVIGVRAREGVDPLQLETALKQTLAARHRADPEDPQAIGSFNLGKQHQRVESLFRGVRAFVWFVCVATLLAGALGVSNIMLISVKERTREFGIRKALGATPGSVIALVLQEASVLTALAGYLGLVAGVAGLELMARYASTRDGPLAAPSIDLGAALMAVLVLIVAGLLSGIAPARHAARISPVAALRAE